MKKLWMVFFILTAPAIAQNDLQGIREQTRVLLGELTPQEYSTPLVDSASNRAIKEAAVLAGILIMAEDTITTAVNVDRYALNADFWRLRSVWKNLTAQRTPITIVDNPYSASGAVGMPSEYSWVSQNSLFFFGLPTGVLKIQVFYYRLPRRLGAASDTTDIPYLLRPALPFLAASFLSYQEGRAEVAQTYYTRAIDLINAYRRFFGNQGDVPVEVRKP
jgi:hypothetical protein